MVVYNICYDIAAIILLVLIIGLYFLKRGIPNYQNRLFFMLIICTMVSALFDIMDVIAMGMYERSPEWVRYFTSGGCYVIQIMEAMLVLIYVWGFTHTWKEMSIYLRTLIVAPFLVMTFLTVTTKYTHILFYYDENAVYVRGEWQLLAIGTALFYLLLVAWHVWRLQYTLSKSFKVILVSMMAIAAAGVIVQTVIPGQLTQMFASALCVLITFFTLQNPFLKIDNYLRVYNRSSFVTMTSLDFVTAKKFSVIAITMDDFSFLQKSMGISQLNSLQREVAGHLKEYGKDIFVYYIEEGCFCMVLNSSYADCIDEMLKKLEIRFREPWSANEISTVLSAHFCRIECPETAKSVEEIFDIVSCIANEPTPERVVSVEDIDIIGKNEQLIRERMIKDAIEYSQFEICYKNIFSLQEKRVNGVEVILKMYGEDGYLYSNECKDLLEKTGQIFRIGVYLFRKACAFLASEEAENKGIQYAEISVSIFLCMQPKFLQEAIWIMQQYKIKPGSVKLKVVESEAFDSPKELREMMLRLKEAGVCFALDEYGTGYANIAFIYELPFSQIEFDKEVFYAAITEDLAMRTLKTTLGMLRELKLQTMICGILTEEQLVQIQELDCDFAMGPFLPEEGYYAV